MTDEELDVLRANEAFRRYREAGRCGLFPTTIAAMLARTNWQPTPAVDPLVDALTETWCGTKPNDADNLRKALASRGLQIVEIAREDKIAECRGIEKALLWCFKHGNFTSTWAYDQARRDLLGEN